MTRNPVQSPDGVQMDAVYPHPPAHVWQALTNPDTLAKWLLPNDFAPCLGHRFTFRDGRRTIHCEVTAVEEARRLTYTWRRGQEPLSVVTWTLEPVQDGQATRVRLTHTGLPSCCAGWGARMGRVLAHGLRLRIVQPMQKYQRSLQ
ncbi:MAG: SRPBCC domain-containing protein [Armatimonadota bacterium]|nr:SRPBCC domain-containing protein [Armatimonadota bacterium]